MNPVQTPVDCEGYGRVTVQRMRDTGTVFLGLHKDGETTAFVLTSLEAERLAQALAGAR